MEGDSFVYGSGNKIDEYKKVTSLLGGSIQEKDFGTERYLCKINFGGETKGMFKKRVHARDHVDGNIFKLKSDKLIECLDTYFFGDQKRVFFDKVMEKESKKGMDLFPESSIMKVDGFWTGDVTIGKQ